MSQIEKHTMPSKNNGWLSFSKKVCNQLNDKCANFLRNHLGVDLIIVTGPTGVGKTSYIKSITGSDLYISSAMESATRQTALVPALIEGKRYLFLDMPGFDADDFDDWHIFMMLMTAMATIEPYVRFRGLIYVDTFDNVRATKSARKILEWVRRFCGDDYMPNVTIVTTKWDTQDDDAIGDKLQRFNNWSNSDLLKPLLFHGAVPFHHGLIRTENRWTKLSLTRKSEQREFEARKMIHERYGNPSQIQLQIYLEISGGCTLDQTGAGRSLEGASVIKQDPSSQPVYDKIQVLEGKTPIRNSKENMDGPEDPPQNPRRPAQAEYSKSWNQLFSEAHKWIRLYIKAVQTYRDLSAAHTASSEPFSGLADSDELWGDDEDFGEYRYFQEMHTTPVDANLSDEKGSSWCAVM